MTAAVPGEITSRPKAHMDEDQTLLQSPASLQAVSKTYNGAAALRELSFTLRPGEIAALLGPNGAGKTTAIRILLGLTRQTSGRASVFGHLPGSGGARLRVGAMLQVGRMPESLRVREHLALFRGYYPRPLTMEELLHIAGLEAVANKLFGELSGGQRQRVLFALALTGDPDLLFLDEPTLGMDVEARRALWAEVRALAARGKTVLLTTHYLQEAEALATRILLLKDGRLLAEGTAAELRERAGAARVLCRSALSEAKLRALPGVLEAVREGGRWKLATNAPERTLRALLERDAEAAQLEVSPMPLEDAFLSYTRDTK